MNARHLPWRNPPGTLLPLHDPDWPYRVWLSEIMLQQTTVAAVKPYFEAFTRRWPSVSDLAAAADEDVMSAWAGLGYYARARNLLACARTVAGEHGGTFPNEEAILLTLPGVGRYTAAAIAAIAFGKRAVVVDGNVERVIARLFAEPDKKKLPALVDTITPDDGAGDLAQGLMDIGATICTPRNPLCTICPLTDICQGKNDPARYPAKPAKAARPERNGIAWWVRQGASVYLVTRPPKGLLGGMRALPSTDWSAAPEATPPLAGSWRRYGKVDHVFTHFLLSLSVQGLEVKSGCKLPIPGEWWPLDRLEEAGLPTVFAKAARLAIAQENQG